MAVNADYILIRFGEFTIKGRNRKKFEKQIYEQVKAIVAPFSQARIIRTFGRLYIALNGESYETMALKLKHVFGIVSFSPVRKAEHELAHILQVALEVTSQAAQKPQTFKVSVRRVVKEFPHPSHEMLKLVSAHVLPALPQLTVQLHKPELELRVEIQPEGVFIFTEVVLGAGGFPYGSNGKALLMLSGGIDSPVAGYMAMRKGLALDVLHFYSYPFTSELARDKVLQLAQKLADLSYSPLRIHFVKFTDIQLAFTQCKQDNLIVTLMRRAMLRIAEQVANLNGALGIVTGDSLGQVASQTLNSMNVIGRATQLPLLRPLVMMDKQQIIQIAEDIETYETSILPYEDCCTLFVPKHPSTNPNLNVVQKVESLVPQLSEMIAEAIATVETVVLHPFAGRAAEQPMEEDWL